MYTAPIYTSARVRRDVECSARVQISPRVRTYLVDGVGYVDAVCTLCVAQVHLGEVRELLENASVLRPRDRVALRALDRLLPELSKFHEVDLDHSTAPLWTRHTEILYEIDAFEKRAPEPFQADVAKVWIGERTHETVVVRGAIKSSVVEVVSGLASARSLSRGGTRGSGARGEEAIVSPSGVEPGRTSA